MPSLSSTNSYPSIWNRARRKWIKVTSCFKLSLAFLLQPKTTKRIPMFQVQGSFWDSYLVISHRRSSRMPSSNFTSNNWINSTVPKIMASIQKRMTSSLRKPKFWMTLRLIWTRIQTFMILWKYLWHREFYSLAINTTIIKSIRKNVWIWLKSTQISSCF